MNNDVLLWILGVFFTVFSITVIAVIKAHGDLSNRVVRLEAVMTLFGEKAARILHSPHDPDGIDSLLEKYVDRHYELSFNEWDELLSACSRIEIDKSRGKDERTLAAFLCAICRHKLRKAPEGPGKNQTKTQT